MGVDAGHLFERALQVEPNNPKALLYSADGQLLVCEPARELPLTQRYFLF